MKRLVLFVVGLVAMSAPVQSGCEPAYDCTVEGRAALFEKRIVPLFAEDRPKSCNQCHLSGIDLTMFIKETPCQTMACLQSRGLVNLDDPDASLLLSWIDRASPTSPLITAEVLAEERAAVHEWISMTAQCGQCATYDVDPCNEKKATEDDCEERLEYVDEPEAGPEIITDDCSERTLEQGFYSAFYLNRFRCGPCHFSNFDEIDEAPKWVEVGGCNIGSLMTMRQAERRGYIDVQSPRDSLLLTKPLDEAVGGVEHGGGPKFHVDGDPFYDALTAWLDHYADCKSLPGR